MPRLAQTDLRRADDVLSALRNSTLGGRSVLVDVAAPLRELLEAEQAGSYGVRSDETGVHLDFMYASGVGPQARAILARAIEVQPYGLAYYDPTRTQPEQRNVAFTMPGLRRVGGRPRTPMEDEVMRPLGLKDQVRAIICDGPALLAWVGAFRHDPFGERERLLLQRLVPALRDRLVLELQLRNAPLTFAALAAALEAIGAAAFVVRGDGGVVHANSAGMALIARDRKLLSQTLRERVGGGGDGTYRLTKISSRGVPDHWLAIQQGGPVDLEPRLARAVSSHALTPRQAEVLRLLVRGHANKVIAVQLGCAESTVELHVTQILHKTGCGNRAELVASFWMRGL